MNPAVPGPASESTFSRAAGTTENEPLDTNAPKSETVEAKVEEPIKAEPAAASNSGETKPNKSLCPEASPSSALHWLADLATQKAKEETKGKMLIN